MPRSASVVLGLAAISDDGHQWIEVIPAVDKARNGPWFFTITRKDLDAYAASIEANAGLIPIDYDHEGGSGGSTVAAGWFTGETATVEAGGENPAGETQEHASLWARVKWTPQAMQEISDGRFKRLSPEFDFHERDKKTGLLTKARDILASTLTNRPFFKQLAPVASDVLWDDATGISALMEQVCEALNPAGSPSPETPYYWVVDVAASRDRALVKSGDDAWVAPFTIDDQGEVQLAPQSEWTPAEQQWVQAAEAASARRSNGREATIDEGAEMPDMKALAAALGLSEDATEEQIIAAAKAAREKTAAKPQPDAALAHVREALGLPADADEAAVIVAARAAREASDRVDPLDDELETLRATAAENHSLTERVKALEAERVQEKVKRVLTEGVRNGQVLPAEKAVLAKQFAGNPDGLLELIGTRPVRAFTAAGSGGAGAEDTESVRAIRSQFDSAEADGVDTESAIVHARAMQLLAEQGKRNPTEAEYVNALELATADSY